MDADSRRRIQITTAVVVVIALARVGFMMYERRETGTPAKKAPTYSANLDDYVTEHKIIPYSLKSAQKELVGKSFWVRAGNQVPYYRYTGGNVDFKHQAGLLPPLAKLQATDVELMRAPVTLGVGQVAVVQKQVMLVFSKPDGPEKYAVSIGTNTGDDFAFILNDVLFSDDPHELYKHWPAETWSSIEKHEVKPGMTELQAQFALGTNMSVGPGDVGNRTVEFANAGSPVTVAFEKNIAATITPGKSQ